MTDRQVHWATVYATKADDSLSWFEETPALSIRLIEQTTDARRSVIDIGGGASRLPDALLSDKYHEHRTPSGAVQNFQFSTFRRN